MTTGALVRVMERVAQLVWAVVSVTRTAESSSRALQSASSIRPPERHRRAASLAAI